MSRLTIIGPEIDGRILARCTCGTVKSFWRANVVSGKSKSCGCLQKERAAATQTTHGLANTPEYRIWSGMISRCSNPRVAAYPHYGGRGIQVCDRWRTFTLFLADMGQRPSPRHSVDRIDSNGNYEPGNCRWSLPVAQSRNRKNIKLLTVGSDTRPLTEWAEIVGIPAQRIRNRLRRGWLPESAVYGGRNAD